MSWLSSLKNKVKKLQWKDAAKFAKKAAPALAFIPGVGTLGAAAIGAAGGLFSGKKEGGLGAALSGAAGGLMGGGLKKLGSMALAKFASGGGGGEAAPGGGGGPGWGWDESGAAGAAGAAGGGKGGIWDRIKDFTTGGGLEGALSNPLYQKLGSLALGGYGLYEQGKQRKGAEKFDQKRLDVIMEQMGRAEDEWDSRAPLREGSQTALLGALATGGSMQDPFTSFMKERGEGKRKAGEFTSSTPPTVKKKKGAA